MSVAQPVGTPTTRPRGRPAALFLGLASLTPLAATAALLWYAVERGLSPRHAVLGAAAVGVTQVLPGALCWRAVRPRRGWLVEDLAMGFAIGSCLAIAAQVVAGLSRFTWLSAGIPLAVGACLLVIPVTRRRITVAGWESLPWWFGPIVGLVSLPAIRQLMEYFHRNELNWPRGAWIPHIDLYLHQALASELLNRGPAAWPTVLGEDLGYHWFTHAWIAQTARVSGLGLDEVLVRFMPAVMPSIVVVATAVAALRLSGRPIAGALAASLCMVGGMLNVFGKDSPGFPVEPVSPTLALGAPTLLALVVVLTVRWRGEALRGAFLLVPLLAVAAAGTKGSTSPLVVAGLGLALVAMLLWDRGRALAVAIDLIVVSAALVFTIVVVFHGSAAGLAFGLGDASQQTATATWLGGAPTTVIQAMATLTTVMSALARGAATFALPLSRQWRRQPLTWLLVGASLAGAGALGVFSHPGRSQLYFALTAIPLLAIGSSLGLLRLAEVLGPRRMSALSLAGGAGGLLLAFLPARLVGVLRTHDYSQAWVMLGVAAAIVCATAAAGLVVAWLLRPRRRPTAAHAATAVAVCSLVAGVAVFASSSTEPVRVRWGPVPKSFPLATTQKQIDAARYIRNHSAVDDIVMTNRHCIRPKSPFDNCDSRRWLVTAFSERQSLVEGWTATPKATELAPHGRDSITVPYWKPDILRLNDGFIEHPTARAARQLWDLGVRWVYVDHTRPYAKTLEPYAKRRYRNSDAEAYQLLPPP